MSSGAASGRDSARKIVSNAVRAFVMRWLFALSWLRIVVIMLVY